jgi:hypothetical protein
LIPQQKLASVILVYTDNNHVVFMDNFYTSPALCLYLLGIGIFMVGTIRANRKGYSKEVRMGKKGEPKPPRGTHKYYKTSVNGHQMWAISWMDSKPVHMISSIPGKIGRAFRRFKVKGTWSKGFFSCPTDIALYNQYMGGVDRADQRMSYFKFHVRCKRAYMHLFFFYIMLNAHNARIAYADLTGNEDMTTREFIKELYRGLRLLAQKTKVQSGTAEDGRRRRRWWVSKGGSGANLVTLRGVDPSSRMTGQHVQSFKESTRTNKKRCVVCTAIRTNNGWNQRTGGKQPSRTSVGCDTCQVFLCVGKSNECWRIWHTETSPLDRYNYADPGLR